MKDEGITSNTRIAKNTIVLYLRMIFIFCVGLFTSRVVLNTLGVVDYGIYNVVGGFVAFFTFLNGAMATATQRFITFEIVHGTIERQRDTFSTAVNIHFALAALIFILAETVGLWFVMNKLVIPDERFTAAIVVYEFSIISCCISVISLPYNAAIIAHEKMSAFAFISILDISLKLGVVYMLQISPWDKLIMYAAFLFMIQLLDRLLYGVYCSRYFLETKYKWVFNKQLLKDMSSIAGWSLFGNLAGVGYTQGLNVLLNMFFGPAVNAARGVAVTVQGAVSGFVSNFQMALNPQITKAYAVNDFQGMYRLIYASSKFSFFMLLVVVLPIIVETQQILILWLKNVPEHSVWFLRLTLCIMLIEAMANPLMIASQATGKVKVYQSVVGGILILIVPIAYFVLKIGGQPETVFIVHLIVALVAQFFRLYIISRQINMDLKNYLREVFVRVSLVFFISLIPMCILSHTLSDALSSTIIVVIVTVIYTSVMIIYVGLIKAEREKIFERANTFFKSKLFKSNGG